MLDHTHLPSIVSDTMNDAFQKSVEEFRDALNALSGPVQPMPWHKRVSDAVLKWVTIVALMTLLLALPVLVGGFVIHTLQGWF